MVPLSLYLSSLSSSSFSSSPVVVVVVMMVAVLLLIPVAIFEAKRARSLEAECNGEKGEGIEAN